MAPDTDMALTVKQLNNDASFLLTFEPIQVASPGPLTAPEPFRVLLDPCDSVPAKASLASYIQEACASPLRQTPQPDVIVVSNARSDHCNEATLRHFAVPGSKTLILAEPAAAKAMRGWKHFDHSMVRPLRRWEDGRATGRDAVTRIAVAPQVRDGFKGEVTVSLIHQKRDLTGLHSAVAITYRPPPPHASIFRRQAATPPKSPRSSVSDLAPRIPTPRVSLLGPPAVPTPAVLGAALTPPASPGFRSLRTVRSLAAIAPSARNRAVSVVYSPYGTSYSCLEPYVNSHLVAEAAVPLTALLHPFDTVPHPWGISGRLGAGASVGLETARTSGAWAWISTHDETNIGGLSGRLMCRRKQAREDVEEEIRQAMALAAPLWGRGGYARGGGRASAAAAKKTKTELLTLNPADEVTLTSEGVWEETDESSPWSVVDEKLRGWMGPC